MSNVIDNKDDSLKVFFSEQENKANNNIDLNNIKMNNQAKSTIPEINNKKKINCVKKDDNNKELIEIHETYPLGIFCQFSQSNQDSGFFINTLNQRSLELDCTQFNKLEDSKKLSHTNNVTSINKITSVLKNDNKQESTKFTQNITSSTKKAKNFEELRSANQTTQNIISKNAIKTNLTNIENEAINQIQNGIKFRPLEYDDYEEYEDKQEEFQKNINHTNLTKITEYTTQKINLSSVISSSFSTEEDLKEDYHDCIEYDHSKEIVQISDESICRDLSNEKINALFVENIKGKIAMVDCSEFNSKNQFNKTTIKPQEDANKEDYEEYYNQEYDEYMNDEHEDIEAHKIIKMHKKEHNSEYKNMQEFEKHVENYTKSMGFNHSEMDHKANFSILGNNTMPNNTNKFLIADKSKDGIFQNQALISRLLLGFSLFAFIGLIIGGLSIYSCHEDKKNKTRIDYNGEYKQVTQNENHSV